MDQDIIFSIYLNEEHHLVIELKLTQQDELHIIKFDKLNHFTKSNEGFYIEDITQQIFDMNLITNINHLDDNLKMEFLNSDKYFICIKSNNTQEYAYGITEKLGTRILNVINEFCSLII